MHKDNSHFFIIISGPTGVGKSDLAVKLAQTMPAEIINGDMGQLYTPLTIGTAKPDWRAEPVPHHLFDILDEPINFSVTQYREKLLETMRAVWARGKIPIVVGGSSFYIKSIFFAPVDPDDNRSSRVIASAIVSRDTNGHPELTTQLWQRLHEIDALRASQINPNDRYRIVRALELWEKTGTLPSQLKPQFEAPANFLMLFVTRDREELYENINKRVVAMINHGWIGEVQKLSPAWQEFLQQKKLIGYPEIIDYIKNGERNIAPLITKIQQKTRNYAKRQLTFWRMLEQQLETRTVNLTLLRLNLYIDQLSQEIQTIIEKEIGRE